MSPALRTTAGVVLLVLGMADLLRFGLKVLLGSPALILGILMTIAGAALLGAGRSSRNLP